MNQRDIKFRAWSDRVCQFNYYKLEEIGVGIYEGSIIQQYTGINDINQKVIDLKLKESMKRK